MSGEFSLIDRFFGQRNGSPASAWVPMGIGDDCAMICPPSGAALLTSIDTLTEGVHFFSGTAPRAIGHKALAVNLSDLAACAATAVGCLLALSLPRVDDAWLAEFSEGFHALANAWNCPLIGGDTTRNAVGSGLAITVTVFGMVPDASLALRRCTAKLGDDIWVAGSLGAAAAAVAIRYGHLLPNQVDLSVCNHALDYPEAQLLLGQALRSVASAAIDVSDGLVADLSHILNASGGLGAKLEVGAIPVDAALAAMPEDRALHFALYGGDDYRLCFTASPEQRVIIQDISKRLQIPLYCIGYLVAAPGIVLQQDGASVKLQESGYVHFR